MAAIQPVKPETCRSEIGPNIANRVTSAFYVRRLKSKRSALIGQRIALYRVASQTTSLKRSGDALFANSHSGTDNHRLAPLPVCFSHACHDLRRPLMIALSNSARYGNGGGTRSSLMNRIWNA